MSWLFSRALVEEFSEESSLDGPPYARLNVRPTQQRFLRNGKTTDFSRLFPSGPTFGRLTESRGEELLTLFLGASHAKTSARLEEGKESPERDPASGERWPASLGKYDPDTHSLKTVQPSLFGDSMSCSVILPRWGMMRRGVLYPLPTPERPIAGNASGLWPTPRNADYKGACKPSPTTKQRMESGRANLPEAVQEFATPQARDYRTGQRERWENKDRSRNQNDQVGGKLNPNWVEWLMGWPIGWSGVDTAYKCSMLYWDTLNTGALFREEEDKTKEKEVPMLWWDNDPASMEKRKARQHIFKEALLQPEVLRTNHEEGESNKERWPPGSAKEICVGCVRRVWRKCHTPSSHRQKPQEQQQKQYTDCVPEMSYENPHDGRNVGTRTETIGQNLPDMRENIQAKKIKDCPLRKLRVLTRTRETISRTTMECKYRTDRLKAIGNGQVPQAMALAWKILIGTMKENHD